MLLKCKVLSGESGPEPRALPGRLTQKQRRGEMAFFPRPCQFPVWRLSHRGNPESRQGLRDGGSGVSSVEARHRPRLGEEVPAWRVIVTSSSCVDLLLGPRACCRPLLRQGGCWAQPARSQRLRHGRRGWASRGGHWSRAVPSSACARWSSRFYLAFGPEARLPVTQVIQRLALRINRRRQSTFQHRYLKVTAGRGQCSLYLCK